VVGGVFDGGVFGFVELLQFGVELDEYFGGDERVGGLGQYLAERFAWLILRHRFSLLVGGVLYYLMRGARRRLHKIWAENHFASVRPQEERQKDASKHKII
jgi:hypothetical protein